MSREIRRAAVLGAGVMGSGIAAHLANAGIPVLLLDIVPPKFTEGDAKKGLKENDPGFRSKFALAGLAGLKKSKPAQLYTNRFLPLIETGNFEDDWDKLADCDWIVEVVVERLTCAEQSPSGVVTDTHDTLLGCCQAPRQQRVLLRQTIEVVRVARDVDTALSQHLHHRLAGAPGDVLHLGTRHCRCREKARRLAAIFGDQIRTVERDGVEMQ